MHDRSTYTRLLEPKYPKSVPSTYTRQLGSEFGVVRVRLYSSIRWLRDGRGGVERAAAESHMPQSTPSQPLGAWGSACYHTRLAPHPFDGKWKCGKSRTQKWKLTDGKVEQCKKDTYTRNNRKLNNGNEEWQVQNPKKDFTEMKY